MGLMWVSYLSLSSEAGPVCVNDGTQCPQRVPHSHNKTLEIVFKLWRPKGVLQGHAAGCVMFARVFRAMEALVNFAYNGRVQLHINNVQAILVGANFLQLGVVKEACCEFLKNRYALRWRVTNYGAQPTRGTSIAESRR